MKRKGRWAYLALVTGVVVILVLLLTSRINLDFDEIWARIRGLDPFRFMVAGLCFYLGLALRGWRWHTLLGLEAANRALPPPLSVTACARYVVVGRFVDSVSPARGGNLLRAYLVHFRTQLPFPRILGTTAVESILDMLLVCGAALAVGTLLFLQGSRAPIRAVIGAGLAGGVAVLLGLSLMARFGARLSRFLPAPLAGPYLQFQEAVLGLMALPGLPRLLTLTLLAWLAAAARWYFVAAALKAPVSLPLVLFISLANALIASVPATPGGVGLVEPGVSAILAVALPVNAAVAVALAERLISYVSVLLLGGLLLVGPEVSYGLTRVRSDRA